MSERLLIVLTRLVATSGSPDDEYTDLWERPPSEHWWAPAASAGRHLLIIHCHGYNRVEKDDAERVVRDFSAAVQSAGADIAWRDKDVGVAIHTGSERVLKSAAQSAKFLRPKFVARYGNGKILFGELARMLRDGVPYDSPFDNIWHRLKAPGLLYYNRLGTSRHGLTKVVGPLIQDLKTWAASSFAPDLAVEIVADQRQSLFEIEKRVFELVRGPGESAVKIIAAAAQQIPACQARLRAINDQLVKDVRYGEDPLPADVSRLLRELRDPDSLLRWTAAAPAEVAAHVNELLSWWARLQLHLDEACSVIVSARNPHQPADEVG
jgi:hypothetical protein